MFLLVTLTIRHIYIGLRDNINIQPIRFIDSLELYRRYFFASLINYAAVMFSVTHISILPLYVSG